MSKLKITFQTSKNFYKYQMISFTLFNTLTSFQNYIYKILNKKFNIFVIIYLDDIIIYIKNSNKSYKKIE